MLTVTGPTVCRFNGAPQRGVASLMRVARTEAGFSPRGRALKAKLVCDPMIGIVAVALWAIAMKEDMKLCCCGARRR